MDDVGGGLAVADQPAEAAQAETRTFQFQFTGQTGEYFRIWIVNVALTILTLGIYSAWATVRTRRYFYAHTRVADAPFSYDARPLPILIGRIIAVTALGVYMLSEYFLPLAIPFLFLLVAVAIPALVVRSLRFRARYSSWHGARFRFAGSYGDAYKYYLFSYLLVLVTLGIMYPLVKAWQKQYKVGNHRFGERQFEIGSLSDLYFKTYILAWFMMLGLGIFVLIFMTAGIMAVDLGEPEAESNGGLLFVTVMMMLLLYGGFFVAGMYIHSRVINAMYNQACLDGDYRFRSRLKAVDLIWLYLTNTLAIIVTLGLAIPWARIRMARYRARCLSMEGPDDFSRFESGHADHERAIGAEVGEAFEVEIGF